MDKCVVCHQENGLGLKNEDGAGAYYLYPPLWGDDLMTIAFLQPNIAIDLIQICSKNNFKAIFIALKILLFHIT